MLAPLIAAGGAVAYAIGIATSAAPLAAAGSLATIAALVARRPSVKTIGVLVFGVALLLPVVWMLEPPLDFGWFSYSPIAQARPHVPEIAVLLRRLAWLGGITLVSYAALIVATLRLPRRPDRAPAILSAALVMAALVGEALLPSGLDGFSEPAVWLSAAAVLAAGGLAFAVAQRAPRAIIGISGAYLLGRFALETLRGAASIATFSFLDNDLSWAERLTTPDFDVVSMVMAVYGVAGLILVSEVALRDKVGQSV